MFQQVSLSLQEVFACRNGAETCAEIVRDGRCNGETATAYLGCGWFCGDARFYRHALGAQSDDKSILGSPLLLLRSYGTFPIALSLISSIIYAAIKRRLSSHFYDAHRSRRGIGETDPLQT